MATGLPNKVNGKKPSVEPTEMRPLRRTPEVIPPPHDLDAEASVLSAILCQPGALDRILPTGLLPRHFFSDANSLVYQAAVELHTSGARLDEVSVLGQITDSGHRDRVGGSSYIADLVTGVPATAYPEDQARRILEKDRARRMRATLDTLATLANSSPFDPDELLRTARDRLDSLSSEHHDSEAWIQGGQLLDVADRPVAWVVPDLFLGPGRPNEFLGFGYSGKTTDAMALNLSVASGLPAWGHYRVNQGIAGHLDYEMGIQALARKYRRLARSMGIDRATLDANLRLCVLPRVRMSDAAFESWLTSAVRREHLSICLIDSLRAAVVGSIDENDSAMRTFLDVLLRVSEATGCTFIVIHHAVKGREGRDARELGRGSSAIFDAAGTVLFFEVATTRPDDAPPGAVYAKVSMSKASGLADGSAIDPFVLRIQDIASDDGADLRWGLSVSAMGSEAVTPKHSREAENRTMEDEIVAFLRRNPRATTNQIVLSVAGTNERKRTTLHVLHDLGRVDSAEGPRGSTVWTLADQEVA